MPPAISKVLLIPLFLSLSACVTQDVEENSKGSASEESSSFAESPESKFFIAKLEDVYLREPCPNRNLTSLRASVETNGALFAAYSGLWICTQGYWDQAGAMATDITDLNERKRIFAEYDLRARKAVENSRRLITQHGPPGSIEDAEMLAVLMHYNFWTYQSMESARNRMAKLDTESDPETSKRIFKNGMLNVLSPIEHAPLSDFLLREYEWDAGTCEVEFQPLSDRFDNTLQVALDRAAPHLSEHEPESYSDPLGYVNTWLKPSSAYFAEHNWTVGVLAYQSAADLLAEYFLIYGQPPMPTLTEAEANMRKFESENPNLWTEFWAVRFVEGNLEYTNENDPYYPQTAYLSKALPQLEWHFDELVCQP